MWHHKDKAPAWDEVYVGQGHHSHRLKRTKWASPFVAGQHGSVTDCMVLYVGHLHKTGLIQQISELQGMRLLSDCRAEVPCVAHVLMAECLSEMVHSGKVTCRSEEQCCPVTLG